MTAKIAASAILACTALFALGGCNEQRPRMGDARPGAFDALQGADARLVAGDQLGVDLHLVAASDRMLALSR